MANQEKIHVNNPEQEHSNVELREHGEQLAKELEKKHESGVEKRPEQSSEALQETAEKLAEKQEKKNVSPAEKRKDTPAHGTKATRKAAYKKTMSETQSQLSAPSRVFSKLIHAKPVEKTSELVGATIARPNALLAGSATAFLLTLVVYLVARHFGYPLTGSESIAAFVVGWVLGIVFDYLRVMVTGKKA